MSLLSVEHVSKSFSGLLAVADVSFQVDEGHIIGLIGPNGAGKTTLFNVIAGAMSSDSGRISFQGRQLNGLAAHQICREGLARTFQVTRPFLAMSCSENVLVALVGRRDRVIASERPELISHVLDFVGLSGKEAVLARDLNLIDKKRLELARALATNPKLVLLDEVLGGLSTLEMTQALNLIRTIRDRLGITILWIEHVVGAVMSICERVLVLSQGRLICEGTPREVSSDACVIEAYLGEADAQD